MASPDQRSDPRPRLTRVLSRRGRLALAVLALLAVAAIVDGFLVEPRLLLGRDRIELDLVPGRFRVVHLSDLHIRPGVGLYDRLLSRIAAEEPDLVLVSGDLVADVHEFDLLQERARDAATWVSRLRPVAPVLAVQGHSEYLGEVVSILADGGVEWISNEGRLIGPAGDDGPGGGILLLGLNQQAGVDAGQVPPPVYSVGPPEAGAAPALLARSERRRNRYLSYDPHPGLRSAGEPADLAAEAGPLAWSGYDASVSFRVLDDGSAAGLAVHSSYPVGQNRAIRLARAKRRAEDSGTFGLTFDGSAPETADGASRLTRVCQLDTGVSPEPGRWYRQRRRTAGLPDRMEVRGRVWPEGEGEPVEWQAWAVDRSPRRVESGTVALWTWGEGTTAYRDLRVVERGPQGRTLLDAPLDAGDGPDGLPAGFRDGARATRLALALARSPEVPPGTPRVVLTHTPDPVVEAARNDVRLVLAGHTHGGQVRLPFFGALVTRSGIGRRYDRGLFTWPEVAPERGPADRPETLLYVNAGVGTSILPVRFFDPPVYAVIDF
jgi:predicted MPP superfamily phosphohydrolase